MLETLLLAAKDPSPLVRGAAVQALGLVPTTESLQVLVEATADEYRLVRVRAAAGIAAFPRMTVPAAYQEQLKKAEQEYLASITARPDQWTSHYNLGNYQLGRGQNQEAVASFEKALAFEPQAVTAMVNASIAHARLGEIAKAEQSLQKALKLAPDNAAANFNMGLLKAEKKEPKQAESYLKKALKADPRMAQAAYNLCVITAKDRIGEAVTWCRKAAETAPAESRPTPTRSRSISIRRATRTRRSGRWRPSSRSTRATVTPRCFSESCREGKIRSRPRTHEGGGLLAMNRDALYAVAHERNSQARDRKETEMRRTSIRAGLFIGALACVLATSSAHAQAPLKMKMTTDIPPGIAIPDTVETRLGTLKFFDGFPDNATVEKLYDNLDFQRAVQAYLLGLAPVSQLANRKGIAELGPFNSTVPIFEDRMDSKSLFLTPNNNTPYTWFWLDLHEGPLVLEVPPKVLGAIDDMWYRFVTDLGFTGPDKGAGGKYLILPPGFKGTCRPVTSSCALRRSAFGFPGVPSSLTAIPSQAWTSWRSTRRSIG